MLQELSLCKVGAWGSCWAWDVLCCWQPPVGSGGVGADWDVGAAAAVLAALIYWLRPSYCSNGEVEAMVEVT